MDLFNVRRLPERRGFSVGGDQTKALGERLEAPILMGLPYISEFIFIFILFVSLTCAEARCVIPLELAPAGLLPFHGADFGRNRGTCTYLLVSLLHKICIPTYPYIIIIS